MEQTWFITGSSRGLGRALVRAALEAGDLVAATARRPAQLDDLIAEYGERIHPIALDVTDAPSRPFSDRRCPPPFRPPGRDRQQRRLCERLTHRDHRRRGLPRPVRDQLLGRLSTSPRRRSRSFASKGGGIVIQISSVGGRVGGSPGIASYQAAKFAIDGFSRVLRAETAPFGVKVMVVEPSGFRTDWAGSSMTVHDIPEAYAPTVGAMNSRVRQSTDGPAGDPTRAPPRSSYESPNAATSPTTSLSG